MSTRSETSSRSQRAQAGMIDAGVQSDRAVDLLAAAADTVQSTYLHTRVPPGEAQIPLRRLSQKEVSIGDSRGRGP